MNKNYSLIVMILLSKLPNLNLKSKNYTKFTIKSKLSKSLRKTKIRKKTKNPKKIRNKK